MDSLVALLRTCTECIKSILLTQHFGSEYELICAELSVQWLRIRLWGESVGLHIEDAQRLQNSLFSRPEVESIITQSVHCIAHILTEIEVLRRKYELRPHLEPITEPSQQAKTSLNGSPNGILQQRMRDNQKQKSFLAITKWALCDSRRFGEKVRKLKSMIDGLEDISQAAGIARPMATPQPAVTEISPPEEESPPPYSFEAPSSRRLSQASVVQPVVATPGARSSFQGSVLLEHYTVLRTFLGSTFADAGHPGSRAQDKLCRLSYTQFKELRTDVYDELIRRQEIEPPFPFLQPETIYVDKRNQARKKLSTLPDLRFTDLVIDVIVELDRRYPHLQEEIPNGTDLLSASQNPVTRRYGSTHPHNTPPPALYHERPMHRTLAAPSSPAPLYVPSTPSPPKPILTESTPICASSDCLSPAPSRTVEIFKTFRVSPDDPTWKVLPVALKKYNIDSPPQYYDLWITYGGVEKRLGPDDMPLALFKRLDKEGKNPMFMMRKKSGGATKVARLLGVL